MFRISLAEVIAFVILALASFFSFPDFFGFPLIIVSLIALIAVTYFGYYYLRLFLFRPILVRGLGVSVLSKNFQTSPIIENKEVLATVSRLRNTHVTSIMWSYTQDFDESTYKKFGLSQYFDKVFYPSDFNTSDAKTYLINISSSLGVSPKKIVLIDSDESVVAAGKSLGMTVLKYSSAPQLLNDLRSIGL